MSVPAEQITKVLGAISAGQPAAAEKLLPLLYDELRRLATAKLAREAPGQTLQPTALLHEAWLRLVGGNVQDWQSRAHFFGAAAEAMRRILVERARRRQVLAQGGYSHRTELTESTLAQPGADDELLAVHEALDQLASDDPQAAQLVKLRYFVGMSMPEAAQALNLPLRSAERIWTFARAWLRHALHRGG
jgi:RNA polymerase sigma factor (TIGR02999 family)